MPDREKLSRGLEHCINEKECEGCVYYDDYYNKMKEQHSGDKCPCFLDAVAMLKEQADEQRARILNVEEVRPNELVYIEVPQSDEICPAFLVEKDWFGHRAWRTTGCGGCHLFLHDGYGRDWRCWSANPTDEQRRAVKWNG